MKQVSVTFNYNPDTDSVTNVKCIIDGIEKKKKTTKKLKEVIKELEEDAIITLESNKIVFNNKCVLDMDLKYGDRLVIKWEKRDDQMVPIIGKDVAFEEEGTGNKLTKSNTITYKGKANTILADFGSSFKIKNINDGIWELVLNNKEKPKLEDVLIDAENTNLDLIVDSDTTTEIDNLQFQL